MRVLLLAIALQASLVETSHASSHEGPGMVGPDSVIMNIVSIRGSLMGIVRKWLSILESVL